jgi:hypothetical protein
MNLALYNGLNDLWNKIKYLTPNQAIASIDLFTSPCTIAKLGNQQFLEIKGYRVTLSVKHDCSGIKIVSIIGNNSDIEIKFCIIDTVNHDLLYERRIETDFVIFSKIGDTFFGYCINGYFVNQCLRLGGCNYCRSSGCQKLQQLLNYD